jgi:Na+-driven multidrug efflux pump
MPTNGFYQTVVKIRVKQPFIRFCALYLNCRQSFFPLLIRVFNSETELVNAGVPAMRQYFAVFFLFGLQLLSQSTFVALGKAKHATFFAIFRKVIVLVPFLLLLPPYIGVDGIFWAESISQAIGALVCFTTMVLTVYLPLGKKPDHLP